MSRTHAAKQLLGTSLLGAIAIGGAGCSEERALTTLAVNEAGPSAIAVDAVNVYWTNAFDGTAAKVSKSADVDPNGDEDTAMTLGSALPSATAGGIVVDATSVYWALDDHTLDDRTLTKAPSSGGAQSTLVDHADAGWFLAIDAKNLYWTNPTAGTVMKASLDGKTVALACKQGQPQGIAVDAGYVYWANQGDGTVMRTAIEGPGLDCNAAQQTLEPLVSDENAPYAIAVNQDSVYWTSSDGTIKKAPIAGGAAVTLASDQGEPAGIAIDATDVYWTSKSNGTVMKVKLGGGAPVMIADQQSAPFGIALDATNNTIYWANQGGTVVRIAK